jgi:hypothetical protein
MAMQISTKEGQKRGRDRKIPFTGVEADCGLKIQNL